MSLNFDINIRNKKLYQIKQFCYFGSTIIEDNCYTVEIKRRLVLDKQTFQIKV